MVILSVRRGLQANQPFHAFFDLLRQQSNLAFDYCPAKKPDENLSQKYSEVAGLLYCTIELGVIERAKHLMHVFQSHLKACLNDDVCTFVRHGFPSFKAAGNELNLCTKRNRVWQLSGMMTGCSLTYLRCVLEQFGALTFQSFFEHHPNIEGFGCVP